MNKIPTIFVRDMTKQPALVINEWMPDTEWVRDGEGIATRKYDGTSCLVRAGNLYKRRELRQGDAAPPDFESLGTDENTGKTVGWVPVGESPEDRWHREGYQNSKSLNIDAVHDGTYELLGPKIQGNKDHREAHMLQSHAEATPFLDVPLDFDGIKKWLENVTVEGLVWHHPDGRMAKIKRRDFGLKW